MNQLNKGKAKYISVLVFALLLLTITLYFNAAGYNAQHFHSFLTADTVPVRAGKIIDSIKNKAATNPTISEEPLALKKVPDTGIVIKKDTIGFKSSNDSLDAPVTYHADDSMVMDIPARKIILYGKETRVK